MRAREHCSRVAAQHLGRALVLCIWQLTGCGAVSTAPEQGNSEQGNPEQGNPEQGNPEQGSQASLPRSLARPKVPTRERLLRSVADLPRERLPNGMKRITLEQRFSHVNVARRNPDGSIELECVDRASQFDRALPALGGAP